MTREESKALITQHFAEDRLACIEEIALGMEITLAEIRNELAEIRGWKDGYVLNASGAMHAYCVYEKLKEELK